MMHMNKRKKYYGIVIVLCSWVSGVFGYGLPGLNLGFSNILDGGPTRPKPGLYWLQFMQYYTTQRFFNAEGKPLGDLPSPRFRNFQTIIQGVYQFNKQLPLSGMPGVTMGIPLVLYEKIELNKLGFRGSGAGFGNLNFGIYTQWNTIMRKGREFFVHRLQFDFSIPCGKNKLPEKNINPGSAFFSCGSYWAATLYLSQKWNVSWRLSYRWSAKNEKINFHAGDAMYLNYSLAYEACPRRYVAAVGYVLGQLHNNTLNNITVPNSKERVFGIGPGAAYFHSPDLIFLGYLYLEGGARNRPQGTSFITRLVMHF